MQRTAIFFDVDGVLIDSLKVKAEAFANLFPNAVRDQVRAFHYLNGGMNRSEKIARMSAELVGIELTSEQVHCLSEKFGSTVRSRVAQASEIRGAGEAVRALCSRYPLHAVSAVPRAELEYVLRERGLRKHFVSIHGAPPAKAETLRMLVGRYHYSREQCFFVGDSTYDGEAAEDVGIPFIFIRSSDQSVPPSALATMNNLMGLDSLISKLLAAR